MFRSVRIQPLSILVGLVLGFVCFLTMSQSTVPTPLRVEYTPHPRDMVRIQGVTPYMVPVGKILVVTALGSAGGAGVSGEAQLRIDGLVEVGGSVDGPNPLAGGLAVPAGSVVTLTWNGTPLSSLRAWGYLVNQ